MKKAKKQPEFIEEDVSMDEEAEDEQEEAEEDESDQQDNDESADDDDDIVMPSTSKKSNNTKKSGKKGIIYISSIPKHMNVAICRELLEAYGQVDRIFLQADQKGSKKNKRTGKKNTINFTEGWVEFDKKKIAKWIAGNLNATPISTKKSSKFCDILWNIKYLSGFKWIHLSERLTYERTVANQKLRLATSKARHEANFFQNNLDKSEKLRKQKRNKS